MNNHIVVSNFSVLLILFAFRNPTAECYETDPNPDGSTGCSSVSRNPRCWRYCSGSEGAWCYTSRGCGSSTESCALVTECADTSCEGAASGCERSCESYKLAAATSESSSLLNSSGVVHIYPVGSTGCSTKWTIFRTWCWRFCSGSSGSWCYTGTDCYWDNEVCAVKKNCAGVGCHGADPGCVDQCRYRTSSKLPQPTNTSTSTEPTRITKSHEQMDSLVTDNGGFLAIEYGLEISNVTIVTSGTNLNCTDNGHISNCNLIVKGNFCHSKYLALFCCKSCTVAGQLTYLWQDLNKHAQASHRPTNNTAVPGVLGSPQHQNSSIPQIGGKLDVNSTTVIKPRETSHANCTDNSYYANCKLIVRSRFCSNKYYGRFCCKACTLAGQLPALGTNLNKTTQSPDLEPATSPTPIPTDTSEPTHLEIACLSFSNNKINRTISGSKPMSWFSLESSFDSRDAPSDNIIKAHYKETTFFSRAPIAIRERSNLLQCTEFDRTPFEIVEQQRKELDEQIGGLLGEINVERPRISDMDNPVVEFYRRRINSSPEVFRVEYLRAEFHPKHLDPKNRTEFNDTAYNWMKDHLNSQKGDVAMRLVPVFLSGPTELYNLVPGYPSVKNNLDTPFKRRMNDWQTVENGMVEFLAQGEGSQVDWIVGLYYDTELGGRPTHFVYQAIFRNNNASIPIRVLGSSTNKLMKSS